MNRAWLVLALLCCTAGCRWSRSDKIGGPAWDTRSVDDHWVVPGMVRAGDLELTSIEVWRQRQRVPVIGTTDCTLHLNAVARNVGSSAFRLQELEAHSVSEEGKRRMFLGIAIGTPERLEPGASSPVRYNGVHTLPAVCDPLAALELKGTRARLVPR